MNCKHGGPWASHIQKRRRSRSKRRDDLGGVAMTKRMGDARPPAPATTVGGSLFAVRAWATDESYAGGCPFK